MSTPHDPLLVGVTATIEVMDGRPRVRLNAAYTRALESAGLVPVVIPPLASPEAAAPLLRALHGLVLTGGEDVGPARYGASPHPELGPVQAGRDATELALAAAARDAGLPTLAICRGIQLLNVALGGTLVQHLPEEWPGAGPHDQDGARAARTHAVAVAPGSRLADALGAERLAVNSMHHQAVRALAPALIATAHAPDGVVEGAESADRGWWAVAVQWHPEELTETPEPWDRALFAAFARAVRTAVAGGSASTAPRPASS
jgi:putative glutamine amidotransferase